MESSREELGGEWIGIPSRSGSTHQPFFFLRAFKFPGLLCDFRGLERDRAGESITE